MFVRSMINSFQKRRSDPKTELRKVQILLHMIVHMIQWKIHAKGAIFESLEKTCVMEDLYR